MPSDRCRLWFLPSLCISLLGMNGAKHPRPEHLRTLQALLRHLQRPELFVSLSGEVLALQALGEAPALLTAPAAPGGDWTLQVFFLLDEFDRPRVAAPRFMAEHGGRVLLRVGRLTVASAVAVADAKTVLGLYRAACRMKTYLEQARFTPEVEA